MPFQMWASAQEDECQGGRSQTIELYSESLGAEVESSAWHHGITLAKLYDYYLKADAQNLQADIESCILSQLGIDDDDWVDSLDVEEQEKFHQDVGKVCKDLQDSFKHTPDFLHKEIDLCEGLRSLSIFDSAVFSPDEKKGIQQTYGSSHSHASKSQKMECV